MVSLDPATKRPAAVNPLLVETAEEKRLFALGEKNMNEKTCCLTTKMMIMGMT